MLLALEGLVVGGWFLALARTSVSWESALGGTSVMGLVVRGPGCLVRPCVSVAPPWWGVVGVWGVERVAGVVGWSGVTRCWVLRDRAPTLPCGGGPCWSVPVGVGLGSGDSGCAGPW